MATKRADERNKCRAGPQCEAWVSASASVRESVGSWSNSHCFIPLKQKVCLRSVAYDTNSGSSSPIVIVACAEKM